MDSSHAGECAGEISTQSSPLAPIGFGYGFSERADARWADLSGYRLFDEEKNKEKAVSALVGKPGKQVLKLSSEFI